MFKKIKELETIIAKLTERIETLESYDTLNSDAIHLILDHLEVEVNYERKVELVKKA